mgnify:CR=1 FL=1|jgi:AraC-like DNA-binding protein
MQNQSPQEYPIQEMNYLLTYEQPVSRFQPNKHIPSTSEVSFMQYHNCMELGLCYDGCGIFIIEGRVYPYSAGDVCIIFENQIHIAKSDKESPSHWRFLNLDPLLMLRDLPLDELRILIEVLEHYRLETPIIEPQDPLGLNQTIHDFFAEKEAEQLHYEQMLKPLTWQILLQISRSSLAPVDGTEKRDRIREIAPALQYISSNITESIYVPDLASICNMSTPHFRRVFKHSMGIPPIDYINMLRIKMASTLLLNKDCSILEISSRVGYSSLSSFNRQFKQIMGFSPRIWISQHQTIGLEKSVGMEKSIAMEKTQKVSS